MTQKLHKSKGTKLNMPQFILISISKLFSASQCSGLLPVTGNEEFFFFSKKCLSTIDDQYPDHKVSFAK